MKAPSASRSLASTYGLGVTEARRDMETVQNWLAFLTSEARGIGERLDRRSFAGRGESKIWLER